MQFNQLIQNVIILLKKENYYKLSMNFKTDQKAHIKPILTWINH
jgi:hypothetical protein